VKRTESAMERLERMAKFALSFQLENETMCHLADKALWIKYEDAQRAYRKARKAWQESGEPE